jgi:hypothetical protein
VRIDSISAGKKAPAWRAAGWIVAAFLPGLLAASCESISVAPTCPAELRVGESGPVMAHEMNPGAIARYQWQVIAPELGRFQSPTAPNTTFQALAEGDATIRLTASDGLFQVMADCSTRIRGMAELAVALTADPTEADAREPVTLTCRSVGVTPVVNFTITQVEGRIVQLVPAAVGVVRFEADSGGELVFQCVGESASGTRSEPSRASVTILAPISNGNGNGNLNANGNVNGNDNQSGTVQNGNVNGNGNGNGNGNVNANDNAGTGNSNGSTNGNDNRGGGRPIGPRR